jgi:antitoxin ParD1/3/4
MPTRNVVLTEHHESLIHSLVASGRYQNASEVLREGLRLVEAREAQDTARLHALREAARVGLDDLENSRFTDLDADRTTAVAAAHRVFALRKGLTLGEGLTVKDLINEGRR